MKKKGILICLLAVAMAFVFTACGGGGSNGGSSSDSNDSKPGSKTTRAFEGIDETHGIHMDVEMTVDKQKTEADIMSKGEKTYVKASSSGNEIIFIDDDKDYYILSPATKTAVQTDDDTTGLEDAVETFTEIPKMIKNAKFKEGTREIGGKTYDTETLKKDSDDSDESVVFCFDGNDLKYIIASEDGNTVQMKINTLDNKVKDSVFKVPEDYTVTVKNVDSDQD
ncbi:MAG: hypothetical protein ACOX4I_00995 [Anaerovoracaceae bacterium]|jgi:hypothetical protein